MNENVFVFTKRRTHRHTAKPFIYAPWTVRTFTTFIFTFFIIISRDLDSCVSVCSVYMRLTFCVFFYHLFRHNLLYKHARQLHSTNRSVCWMCVFLSFVSFFLFSSFAAVSYEKKTLILHVHIDSAIQSILFIIVKFELGQSQLQVGLRPNRNITYVFVVMEKSLALFVCAVREKLRIYLTVIHLAGSTMSIGRNVTQFLTFLSVLNT